MNVVGVSFITVAWYFVHGTFDTLKASTVGVYIRCIHDFMM